MQEYVLASVFPPPLHKPDIIVRRNSDIRSFNILLEVIIFAFKRFCYQLLIAENVNKCQLLPASTNSSLRFVPDQYQQSSIYFQEKVIFKITKSICSCPTSRYTAVLLCGELDNTSFDMHQKRTRPYKQMSLYNINSHSCRYFQAKPIIPIYLRICFLHFLIANSCAILKKYPKSEKKERNSKI